MGEGKAPLTAVTEQRLERAVGRFAWGVEGSCASGRLLGVA